MNIAFDGIALLGPMSKNRGIGNYALSQLRTILRKDRKNKYFFFNVLEETDIFAEEIQDGLISQYNFPMVVDRKRTFSEGFYDVYRSLLINFLADNKIDIFYITSPFDGSLPTYLKEWFGSTKVIATVYDIIPYVMKSHYFPNPADMKWYMERIDMLRWCDRYVVISQSVKDDLVHYLSFPAEKIDIIWGAPHNRFREINVPEKERIALCEKFGIDSPFVMCTGGDDERKNIAALISAFGKLPTELTKKFQLVIVCKLQDASARRYRALAKQLRIENRVVITNFVTDDELLDLYNLASLVAFPSTYEGFGLPVVEAWACGRPVLTSNNSSLVQIAGDAAVLVDPFSVDDISHGLEHALTEADLRQLAERGRKRLREFQWDMVAQWTIDSFQKAGAGIQQTRQAAKRRIAFFSPLPPVQSGISDYSVDMLWELRKYFDIDVFIDNGYKPDCKLPESTRIFLHADYEAHRAEYFDTVFQMGNSEYHIYMWQYLRRYGGTLVLHDYNMHGVFRLKALAQDNNIALYQKIIEEEVGPTTALQYIRNIKKGAGPQIHSLELNSYLANYADQIIVHSEESKRKLLIRDSHRNVAWIRHYAKIDEMPHKVNARNALGIPSDAFVVAAFGHIHETKRVIPLVYAFARLAKKHPRAQLIFVGKLDQNLRSSFSKSIDELSLSNRVTVTGYTDLARFKQYIDATDVCVNLRWPYNGETSGSLMRILAKGKCVVVNDVGSFSEIPDNACVKLPSVAEMTDGQEVVEIFNVLNQLIELPEQRERFERAARKFAEDELDIAKIGKQYADFINAKRKTCVTDELLGRLKAEAQRERFSDGKLRQLAKILSYA